MTNTIRSAVAKFSTGELQHARRTLEDEAIKWATAGVSTQELIGKIELLTAIGAELDDRCALLPAPAFLDTCIEDGIRYPFQVRVY